nr:unnamed protein product [Callosobruchus chinensis]
MEPPRSSRSASSATPDRDGTHREAVITGRNESPNDGEGLVIHNDVELPDDILCILGDDPNKDQTTSFTLHPALASRWSHILTNGIDSEVLEKLRTTYGLPSNTRMTAPRINPEISVILSAPQQARDNAHLQYQTSVGTALSALGSGLNILLQQDQNIPSDVKESLLKPFGDAGRILANVFASISSNRRKMILPLLAKNIKEIAETTVPTELLFGDELGDKIKSAKLAETTGKSIKATYTASHKSPYPKTGGGAMKRPHSQYIPENRYRPTRRAVNVREARSYRGRYSRKQEGGERIRQNRRK